MISATYNGHTLSAVVEQDSGNGFLSELCVIWSDESMAHVGWLSSSERDGAVEAIEEAFWASEAEQCRLANVRQQRGEVAA